MISDVIMPIAAILKISFYDFFVNVTKYDCAKFHDKNLFLSGFRQGVTMCPSTPPPFGAWSDKNTLRQIGLIEHSRWLLVFL